MRKIKIVDDIPNKVFADMLFRAEPSGLVIKSDTLRLHVKVDNPTFLYERALITAFNKEISSEIQFSVQEFKYICYEDGMIWFEDNTSEVAFFEGKISFDTII